MTPNTQTEVATPAGRGKKRRFRRGLAIAALVLLVLLGGLAIYLNSDSFRETVRARVIADLERATGGRVEIGSFTWKLSELQFEIHNLTIHGREAAYEVPYAHADRICVDLKVISFFSRKISLEKFDIDGAVFHLIIYPNGSTNQPSPQAGRSGNDEEAKDLFDLAIKETAINNGTFIINQEKIPFVLGGKDLSAGMSYVPSQKAYDGHLDLAPLHIVYREHGSSGVLEAEVHTNFLMREKETEIKSLKISTKTSQLEASGTLRNYNHPEVTLQYQASLDLPEVARKANVQQLRAGRADLKGVLTYQNQRYSSQGTLSARGAEWRDATVRLTGIDATSPYTVTPDKIVLPRLIARAFGGNVQGSLQVTNWNTAPVQGRKGALQNGAAKLHVSGVEIRKVAEAISTPRLRLDKVDLAGSVAGDINAAWSGSPKRAVTDFKLEVNPPSTPTAKEVPVTAQLQAVYHGDIRTLDVAELTLATRAIRVSATGELGSEKAQARVSLNATDLHELQPALDALAPGTRIPVVLEGRSSFNGAIFGKLDALSARGRVELEKFDTEFRLPNASTNPNVGQNEPKRLHWDALSADLNYSPSMVSLQRGTLRRGVAQFGFSASASLHQGDFDEKSSQLNVSLHIQNENVADIQALAETNYPITGMVNADLQVAGTLSNLHGGGKLQISKLTAYGEPYKSFTSDLRLNGSNAALENIFLAHNGARLTGSAAYNFGNKNFQFDLSAANIDFDTFRDIMPARLSVQGQAGFHVTGSGTEDEPVINGQVDLRNIVLNHEMVGTMTMQIETHGEEATLRGRSAFTDAELSVDGKIHLRGDWPGQTTIKFSRLDFDPLIRAYFQGQITGHSSIAGAIEVRGPMQKPTRLSITGNVSQLSADVENVKLQNSGPIHLAIENGALKVDEFDLIGNQTDISIQGSAQLIDNHALDLRSKGRFDLKLLQLFNPNLAGNGPATFTVNIGGNSTRPQFGGRLELADASVSFVDLPNGLSHINGSLVFAQDRMQIEKLTAQTGGGNLNVGGFLAFRNGLYFDLTATGKDVRLRYPPGVSSSADATLRYTGSARNSLLSGDIVVTRFGMNPHFDFASYLAQSKKAPVIATLNPFLDNMRLDLHITSTPDLRVETSLAKLSGDLDLHVRGTAARPAIVGRVNIAEGDIFFNGTKYRLERGDITFSNPLTIDPVINIDMSARVQDYDITIGLHGSAASGKGLSMTYRSDPPLSNDDIIALLAFGHTRDQTLYNASQPGQNTNDAATASNAILGEALNATFSDRVQRLFGASRVKVDPQFIGSENNPSARLTIEQTINNNITFTYATSLTQSAETVIQVEYNIDKNVSIVAVRDQNGVLGFDVHIRKRKK
ncbi:MAG TPA: translocation/assembly module TamB domain-containing protein [Candidatus Angelobacter sp.]|nr:translocation/assembly module TamB domain-containing protein [Candidatus Angelobacter sp.]